MDMTIIQAIGWLKRLKSDDIKPTGNTWEYEIAIDLAVEVLQEVINKDTEEMWGIKN